MEVKMNNKWFDVTVPIRDKMLNWPGDPEVEIYRRSSIEEGDEANVSGINFGLHTGTHMDSPLHFIDKADDITKASPEELIGKAKVINIKNPDFIGKEELKNKNINKGDRVLFRTRNSDSEWFNEDFKEDFVYLDDEGAEYLASLEVKVIGIDYLSIGKFEEGEKTHKLLLNKNIWIIEGLYLNDVPEGEYELIALPLKISGADGAPARVILKTI
jgi:arylformamidase